MRFSSTVVTFLSVAGLLSPAAAVPRRRACKPKTRTSSTPTLGGSTTTAATSSSAPTKGPDPGHVVVHPQLNPAVNRASGSNLIPSSPLDLYYAEPPPGTYSVIITTALTPPDKGILLENIASLVSITCTASGISLDFADAASAAAANAWPVGTVLFTLADGCNAADERGVYKLTGHPPVRRREVSRVQLLTKKTTLEDVAASLTISYGEVVEGPSITSKSWVTTATSYFLTGSASTLTSSTYITTVTPTLTTALVSASSTATGAAATDANSSGASTGTFSTSTGATGGSNPISTSTATDAASGTATNPVNTSAATATVATSTTVDTSAATNTQAATNAAIDTTTSAIDTSAAATTASGTAPTTNAIDTSAATTTAATATTDTTATTTTASSTSTGTISPAGKALMERISALLPPADADGTTNLLAKRILNPVPEQIGTEAFNPDPVYQEKLQAAFEADKLRTSDQMTEQAIDDLGAADLEPEGNITPDMDVTLTNGGFTVPSENDEITPITKRDIGHASYSPTLYGRDRIDRLLRRDGEDGWDTFFDIMGDDALGQCDVCGAIAGVKEGIDGIKCMFGDCPSPPPRIVDTFTDTSSQDFFGSWGYSANAKVWVDPGLRAKATCIDCSLKITSLKIAGTVTIIPKQINNSKNILKSATFTVSMTSVNSVLINLLAVGATSNKFDLASASSDIKAITTPKVFTISPKFLWGIGMQFETDSAINVDGGAVMTLNGASATLDVAERKATVGNIGWQPTTQVTYPNIAHPGTLVMTPYTKLSIKISLTIFGKLQEDAIVMTSQSNMGFAASALEQDAVLDKRSTETSIDLNGTKPQVSSLQKRGLFTSGLIKGVQTANGKAVQVAIVAQKPVPKPVTCSNGSMKLSANMKTTNNVIFEKNDQYKTTIFDQNYKFGSKCFPFAPRANPNPPNPPKPTTTSTPPPAAPTTTSIASTTQVATSTTLATSTTTAGPATNPTSPPSLSGNCKMAYTGISYTGATEVRTGVSTLEECYTICARATSYSCKGIEWGPSINTCWLWDRPIEQVGGPAGSPWEWYRYPCDR